MRIGLFVPCYIDAFFPAVGIATLELLERFGHEVVYPRDQSDAIEQPPEVTEVRERTYEIVEFLHDILKVDAFPWARFPHRVGLHNSCGTLRRLKHAKPSELHEPFFSKPLDLLSKVADIELVT